MEQKLSDTLVKAIDRSNPMMQNLQLASRFNKLVEEGGGGADLEDNKEATIDVSAYTDPVEVTPTQGKDGMKKVTVSLSNMPAGANMFYAWVLSSFIIYTQSETPNVGDPILQCNDRLILENDRTVESYDSSTDTLEWDGDTFTRDATKDVELWNAPPEVETTKQATIDVSTYDPANKPVITPTAGKQSMAEVEVTLDNIPSGGMTFYGWGDVGQTVGWTLSETPKVGDTFYPRGYDEDSIRTNPSVLFNIIEVTDDSITYGDSITSYTVLRFPSADVTFPITLAP